MKPVFCFCFCFFSTTSYYHPVLSKLAVKGTPCQAKHSLRSIAKISTASSQPFDRVFAVSIVKCNPTVEVLAGECEGLKKMASGHLVEFPFGQVTFHFHLMGE